MLQRFLGIALLLLLIFRFGKTTKMGNQSVKTGSDPVRGIRNNNPGNIRKTSTNWKGQVIPGQDDEFIEFETMEYGARAMILLLRNYITLFGRNTIEKIVNAYSPPSDNNPTEELIKVYAKRLGKRPDEPLSPSKQFLKDLAKEIAKVETANHPAVLDDNLWDRGYNML